MRAGAHALMMAADPINRGILRTVLERPLEVEPGRLFRVSGGGREALFIAFVIERWLQNAPREAIAFDSKKAATAVTALAEGWSTTVIHALARGPLSLTELRAAVPDVSRPALKAQLTTMQAVGQASAEMVGREAHYAVTDWLRLGLAPLVTAARLERNQPVDGTMPIDALDVEAAFLLTLPLLELPPELSGICRLGVNLADDESSSLTGVIARIDRGRVVSCKPGLSGNVDAWAAAPARDWLDTVIEPDAKGVRTGGDRWLARALLDRLHKTLFGITTG